MWETGTSFKIQNQVNTVTIGIEKENGFSQRAEETIWEEANDRLAKTIDIQFEYAKNIESQPNGKFKFVIQNISIGEKLASSESSIPSANSIEAPTNVT